MGRDKADFTAVLLIMEEYLRADRSAHDFANAVLAGTGLNHPAELSGVLGLYEAIRARSKARTECCNSTGVC